MKKAGKAKCPHLPNRDARPAQELHVSPDEDERLPRPGARAHADAPVDRRDRAFLGSCGPGSFIVVRSFPNRRTRPAQEQDGFMGEYHDARSLACTYYAPCKLAV